MASDHLLRMAWAQCWQLSLLIVAVAILARLLCHNRPHLAHVLWLVVLAKCVTPPVWTSAGGVFCWLQPGRAPVKSTDNSFSLLVSRPRPDILAFESSWAARDVFDNQIPMETLVPIPSNPLKATSVILTRPLWPHTIHLFIATWLVGAAAIVSLAGWRWYRCWRTICAATVERRDDLQALVGTLARRLRIRRPVRLLVTASRIGPAVVGIWRPTILLPKVVVQNKSADDLEPILAHELLHVRRGDLGIGMWQVVSQSVWWFHPLVWLANRFLSRDAERCCDEEVIAELGCDPARYARSLVDVLELKRTLQPVPAFPGVRPVEVTSRRLERIMKLRQGCRKRTPWWCWLVMLLVAALTLPGAAFVAAGGRAKRSESANSDREVAAGLTLPLPEMRAGADQAPLESRSYAVKDILRQVQSDLKCTEADAKQTLVQLLRGISGARTNESESQFSWSNRRLVVRHSASGHDRIAHGIKYFRENGIQHVMIEVCVISGPPDSIAAVYTDWQIVDTEVLPEQELAARQDLVPRPFAASWTGAAVVQHGSVVETSEMRQPAMFAVLENDDAKAVLARIQASPRISIISRPKILTIGGQQASVMVGSERPFVVGFKKAASNKPEPQIRIVPTGFSMHILPLPRTDNQVKLECELQLSRILDVEERELDRGPNAESLTVQVPEVVSTKLHLACNLPLGRTLLIGGLKNSSEKNQPLATLIMLRCTTFSPGNETASAKPNPIDLDSEERPQTREPRRMADSNVHCRTYHVADLVVPIPKSVPVVVSGSAAQIGNSANRPSPISAEINFDPLIKQIKSSSSPESWEDAGGNGAIEAFPTNLSLIVRQTTTVHEQIAAHLKQLRREQDVQVCIESQLLRLPEDFFGMAGIDLMAGETLREDEGAPQNESRWRLSAKRRALLLQAAAGDSRANQLQAPKMTLFQRQAVWLDINEQNRHFFLQVQPTVSDDRKSVSIRCLVGPNARPENVLMQQTPVELEAENTLLIDVTQSFPPEVLAWSSESYGLPVLEKVPSIRRLFKNTPVRGNSRMYLLMTPRVIVSEEEEEVIVPGRVASP